MVIYQEKNTIDNDKYAVKLRPTAEQYEYDLKVLNCQEILHFNANMQPSTSTYVDSSCLFSNNQKYSPFDTLLWVLCRLQYDQSINNFYRPLQNSIPGWTSFQQLLSSETSSVTMIGFSPIIPEPPTSKDVVYTALKHFVNLNLSLNKQWSVLSRDMSIYLIAKDIQQTSEEFQQLILRIRTFHLQKNFFRCLGHYIAGTGLNNVLVKANVYVINTLVSISKVLSIIEELEDTNYCTKH